MVAYKCKCIEIVYQISLVKGYAAW